MPLSPNPTRHWRLRVAAIALSLPIGLSAHAALKPVQGKYFERIATFPVYLNLADGEDRTTETVAEITTVSGDGSTLYYTDSPRRRVGLVDIRDAAAPQPAGYVELEGEPTSVATHRHFILVAINTSLDFARPDGSLEVFDIRDPRQPRRVASLPMGGQPDSVAVSPTGRYAAVAIENERNEDLNKGLLPQFPAGHLNVIDLAGKPGDWRVRKVALTGLARISGEDPEPEYVSINALDIAAVTLQENNHIVLVDLRRGRVLHHFSAGSVDLHGVDIEENQRIEPTASLLGKRREPDAIAWVGPLLATANEGDYKDADKREGGSRGFSLFDPRGKVWYDAGTDLEHALIRAGHYPESRSENKGVEPEGIASARFGTRELLFVGSERGNAVAVYDASRPWSPRFQQLLPTGVGPEGLLPIPSRNLLVVSSETDVPGGYRSTLSIYRLGATRADYPQIHSDPAQLLPWGALSGMVADRTQARRLYAVPDSYYKASRIYRVDATRTPAMIDGEIELHRNGSTVDYDLEGIAQASNGDFWLASEGDGKARPNLLVRTRVTGEVIREYVLPDAVAAQATSNGFEGLAVTGEGALERVYVAFQREWRNDPPGHTRIAVFNPNNEQWRFFHYPLDKAGDGAWVGLSEITAVDEERFLILERDNRSGPDARIKRLYGISIAGVEPGTDGARLPILRKRLIRDLLPDLTNSNGWVPDKVEGVALDRRGELFVVTDNDGVEDASGETRFLRLGRLQP